MARFAFAARSTNPDVIAAVRGLTGRPLAEIKQNLAFGTPFHATENHEEDDDLEDTCNQIFNGLKRLGVEPTIYLMGDFQQLKNFDPSKAQKMTLPLVHNLLRQTQEIREQVEQDQARELGDDE